MKEKDVRFDFDDYIENVLKLKENDDVYCQPYQKNNCFNKNCSKLHVKLDRAIVCKHWLRGLCKRGKNCEFLHEYNLKKMPECWFFSKYGQCGNPECFFLHIDPNAQCKECPWYKRGFCRNGPMCRNRHVKKKLCADYYAGFCINGPECNYGHPTWELPDVDVVRKEQRKNIIEREKNVLG